MTANPSFSDWLEQEVEPKIRIIREWFEKKHGTEADNWSRVEIEIYGTEVARAGISPFVYWLRDRASSNGASPNAPSQQTVASTLSHLKELEELVEFSQDRRSARGRGYLAPPVWTRVNGSMRSLGYQYDRALREWVKPASAEGFA